MHRSLWKYSPVRRSEPVLFILEKSGLLPRSKLLFRPRTILDVRLSNGTAHSFHPKDFRIEGHEIVSLSKNISFLSAEDLYPEAKGEQTMEWHRDGVRHVRFCEGSYFHDLQVVVDYETDERWAGPVPEDQTSLLPRLRQRIDANFPVTVALLGDSISSGANASGRIGAFPYQPPYGELLRRRIEMRSSCDVVLRNFSKGGMLSHWGLSQLDRVAIADPDLVIIAFGMNDASELCAAMDFQKNIHTMVSRTRELLPTAEFVLVSGMSPNPNWHLSEPQRRIDFQLSLAELRSPHVAVCNVKSTWDYLVSKKGFWSLTGNGINHPNDFGHRIYADCLETCILGSTTPPEHNNVGGRE